MPSGFDLRNYVLSKRPRTHRQLVIRISVSVPAGVLSTIAALSEWAAWWRFFTWSVAGVAIVWLLAFFVRPFLDWWYRDVDTFASLRTVVNGIQQARAYGAVVGIEDEHDAYEWHLTENQLAELTVRLGRLGVHPVRLAPSSEELDESLAVLSGYMEDRDLQGARVHFAVGTEDRMKKIRPA